MLPIPVTIYQPFLKADEIACPRVASATEWLAIHPFEFLNVRLLDSYNRLSSVTPHHRGLVLPLPPWGLLTQGPATQQGSCVRKE